ncbi:MAG: hypothetical protein P1Q69_18445 [Candidatus Thorarchaeota archaeon]|nr:hypothetical protein [Candidatus Thorarchaeota archaeon]
MKVMAKETSLEINKIISEAVTYFKGFFGLQVADHVPNCCVEFSNNTGYVTVQVFPKGSRNEVILTTREWDYQVLEFMKSLHS